jgi:hypothetical protein
MPSQISIMKIYATNQNQQLVLSAFFLLMQQAPPYNAYPEQQPAQGYAPYSNQQPTVVIINQNVVQDNTMAAGCCGFWLGCCFSPLMYEHTRLTN